MTWKPGPLKYWLALNDTGVWGDDPTGDTNTLVVRSTEINLDGSWSLDDVAERHLTPVEATAKRLRAGDLVVVKSSGSAEHLGKTAIVRSDVERLAPCFANFVQRLRPNGRAEPRFVWYVLNSKRAAAEMEVLGNTTTGLRNLNGSIIGSVTFPGPPVAEQKAIADFLDTETARIGALIAKKRRLLDLLDERVDSRILTHIGDSPLAGGSAIDAVPLRRVLSKLERRADHGDMITAFRDGEVTTREARGREGFTNAWTEGARFQLVEVGDVVVHGLDGFSGAIGDAQRGGVCSPVYHVCDEGDGDGAFYGRMLRLLALGGYLGNFATSTRERAVDFRNWDLFGRIPVPLVPLDEQRTIGDEIRRIRPLRERILASEALAQEHRQALITAAVTGQLDIPGVAA